MSFAPLRSLLAGAARRSGITRDLAITDALRAACIELERVFGAEYGKFAEATAVRPDGGLTIVCRSPAVAQTIRMQERAIVGTVARAAPSIAIQRLILVPRSASDLQRYIAEASAPPAPLATPERGALESGES